MSEARVVYLSNLILDALAEAAPTDSATIYATALGHAFAAYMRACVEMSGISAEALDRNMEILRRMIDGAAAPSKLEIN